MWSWLLQLALCLAGPGEQQALGNQSSGATLNLSNDWNSAVPVPLDERVANGDNVLLIDDGTIVQEGLVGDELQLVGGEADSLLQEAIPPLAEYANMSDKINWMSGAARQGKIFSVFSIVSFPNGACTSIKDGSNGTCLSSADCTSAGGTAEGTCAAGFGICCIIRFNSCGSTVTSNLTVLQSPGFPSGYNTIGVCSYYINRAADNICQIRLDFLTTNLGYSASSPTGCILGATDYMSFSLLDSISYPAVCGKLSGQHMYFEVGTTGDSVQVDISTAGVATFTRAWNILVTQIGCTDPWRAPDDCLQYYTGFTGNIQSFNFPNGQVLSSQSYRICIRQEEGYCSISYSASSTTSPNPFNLLTAVPGGTTTVDKCTKTYVGIPMGGDTGVYDSQANRYCGPYFTATEGSTRNGQVISATVPFEVFFASDKTITTPNKSTFTGFNLDYRQRPCSIT